MGVVINNDTGLAENLPNAEKAIADGTHDLPLVSPEGQQVVAPVSEAMQLLQQGYAQPSQTDLKRMLKFAEHSSTSGQIKAGLESIASGATLGASRGIERAMGVKPEDMQGRAEANPLTSAVGEAAGFMLPATFAPEVALPSKLGAAATKAAIEGAMFQGGTEVGKAFMNDPNQSVESAIAHTGLAAVMGAGFGGALKGSHMLWEQGPGQKLKQYLSNPEVINTLWSNIPSLVGGAAAAVTGHNPLVGAAVAKAAGFMGKEAPEAVHLALLKFLGTAAPEVEAAGVKAAAEMAASNIRTEKSLSKGVQAIFDRGYSYDPFTKTRTDIDALKASLEKLEQKPEQVMDIGGKLGVYMGEHASALGMVVGRSMQYLQNLKPKTLPASPLDSPLVASKTDEAKYNQALQIANNPLSVLKSIRDGSITQIDIQHLQALYPALYGRMQSKVSAAMVQAKVDGTTIPYPTRQALSMFLKQPLDSSFTPANLQSVQMTFMPKPEMMPQQSAPKGDMKAVSKMPSMYQTPAQARAAHRNK